MVRSIFGINAYNIELYKLALIHSSASLHLNDGRLINNERLEYLGDAILESIVSDYLFIEFPDQNEGFLTQMRSKIVSRTSLNEISKQIGLDRFLVANRSGNFIQKNLYGNAFEAMIGAMYLDRGYDTTNRVVINGILKGTLDIGYISNHETDFKSRLIEWCQKSRRTIVFQSVDSADSTQQRPKFDTTIFIDSIELGHGSGSSKKEAEQQASYSVTQVLSDNMGDFFMDNIDSMMDQLGDNNQPSNGTTDR